MPQSLVAEWNELMLEAIREGSAKPTATTYELHLVTAAMYDAWAAYEADASGHYSQISPTGAESGEAAKAEAISYAAYAMLSEFYPAAQGRFANFMDQLGYDTADSAQGQGSASEVGNLAAANVWAARANDGSNYANAYGDTTGYTPVNDPAPGTVAAPGGTGFDPNHWQPLRVPTGTLVDSNGVPFFDDNDPASYNDQVALTPQWGMVDSFAMSDNTVFRPAPPPQLGDFGSYTDGLDTVTTGDQAYRDQVQEVLDTSAGLTTEQKVIAEFWADGPRTESPPGHWNQIAQDIALREGHGIDEDAKMFFALNAAVFDAGIATWEAKYHYDYIRPQSAIRDLYYDQIVQAWAGPDEGTQGILGQEWQPYQNVTFVTPPFPEFVSGHSTFSMAAAMTIASFVGSDVFYDGTTQGNYDLDDVAGIDLLGQYVATELAFEDYPTGEPAVVLQWETLTEAAEEAGASRIYGGIHIQDGNLRGLEVGEQVAINAQVRWDALFTRGGQDTLVAAVDGGLLLAGGGRDSVSGRVGDDIVELGSGIDWARTNGGNDTVYGEGGRDKVWLGGGDDVGVGGSGRDILHGNNDNDVLMGGDHKDLLFGGAGNDSFVFMSDDIGYDTIRDFDQRGDTDELILVGFGQTAAVRFTQVGEDVRVWADDKFVVIVEQTDAAQLVLGQNVLLEAEFLI